MNFTFNPNLIGSQTTSVKPKIVDWTNFPTNILSTVLNFSNTSPSDATEGEVAWAAFKFVKPDDVTMGQQLMDSASLKIKLTGASPSDYVNGGQLFAVALNADGSVNWTATSTFYTQPSLSTTKTSGTLSFADGANPVSDGTGVWGILLWTPILSDTLVETGDRALFQVTNDDPNKFTDSAYVEKYVNINDKFPAVSLPEVVVSNHTGWGSSILAVDPTAGASLYTSGNDNGLTPPVQYNNPPGSEVLEGQWAYATFDVVAPGTTNSSPVQFDTKIKATYSGASPSDYVPNSFKVFAWGPTLPGGPGPGGFVGAGGNLGATTGVQKNSDGTYTLPAGTTHIAMAVKTAKDALPESGEEVLFQFGKTDVNSFTASDYVEKKIKINDSVNQWNVAGNTTFTQQANVQDNFKIAHGATYVSDGTTDHNSPTYKTINGLSDGDFLSIDILGVSNPGLHLANWGVLPAATVPTEEALIQGLRQLDGVQCAQGGVYVMQVQGHTYVVVDSDYSGTLVMNSVTNADIFVKLAGVAASTIQSTDFVLS